MFAKVKILHKNTQQLLRKMANLVPTIDGLSSALLLFAFNPLHRGDDHQDSRIQRFIADKQDNDDLV